MVIATMLGLVLSVMLGCGLFAAAVHRVKSGYDQQVDEARKREREGD